VVFNDKPKDFGTVAEVEAWLSENFNKISNVVKSVWLINPTGKLHLRGFAATLTLEQVEVLQLSKDVAWIEEDSVVSLPTFTQNETRTQDLASDWGITRVNQRCLPLTSADFDACTGNPSDDCTGVNSVVWVADTGIRIDHDEFGGRATYDANFAAGDPSPWNGDCNGHGTHCSGSVGGKQYGVAKAVSLKSVRVLNCQGSGTTQGVIDGVNYVSNNKVDKKRNILSMSLGGGASPTLDAAVTACADNDIHAIVAAGNDNQNACNYSPARAARTITVGATTNTDARSSFSNWGTCVNVFAPGSSITSAWYTSTSAINTISGTSMATPIVAGSVAIISTNVGHGYNALNAQISSFATQGVVSNAGTGSPNFLVYDRWNDGTSLECKPSL